MSVFKRLSNVARGKVREMGRTLGGLTDPDSPDDGPDELDPDAPPGPKRTRPDVVAAKASSHDEKLAMLAGLLAEGLLTQDEYDEKVSQLEGSGPSKKARFL